MTVRVSVVLNRTLVSLSTLFSCLDCRFDKMCGSCFQSQSETGDGEVVSRHLMVFNSDW